MDPDRRLVGQAPDLDPARRRIDDGGLRALTGEQVRTNARANQLSRTGSARRPRGPGSTRSPSRACEWPWLRGCAGARSRPGRYQTAFEAWGRPSGGANRGAGGAELGQQHRRRPQRIHVAPVRADYLDPARRRIDDGGLGRRYPGEQVRANPLANQTYANPAPHGAREAPGPPVRLRALANGGPESIKSRDRGIRMRNPEPCNPYNTPAPFTGLVHV